jgi:hypothetical protein
VSLPPIPQGIAAIEISCPEFGTVQGRREVCARLLTPEIVAMMQRQNLDPSNVNSMIWPVFGLSRHATCQLLMTRRDIIDLCARDPQIVAPAGGQNTAVKWNPQASYRIWFICGSKETSETTRFDRMRIAEIQPLVAVEMGDPVIGDALYIVTFKCDRWAWRSHRFFGAWRTGSSDLNLHSFSDPWPTDIPASAEVGSPSYKPIPVESITPDLHAFLDNNIEKVELEDIYFHISHLFDKENTNDPEDIPGTVKSWTAYFVGRFDQILYSDAVNVEFSNLWSLRASSASLFSEIDRICGTIGRPQAYFPIAKNSEIAEIDGLQTEEGKFFIGDIEYYGPAQNSAIDSIESTYRTRLIAGTLGRIERSARDGEYSAGQPFWVDFSEIRYNTSPYWDIVSMPVATSPDGYIGNIWNNHWRWQAVADQSATNQIIPTGVPPQSPGTQLISEGYNHNPFSDQVFLSFCHMSLDFVSYVAPKDASTFGPFADFYVTPEFATHVSAMDIQPRAFRDPLVEPVVDRDGKSLPNAAYAFGYWNGLSYTGASSFVRRVADTELWFSGWVFPNFYQFNALGGSVSWIELRLQTDGKGFPYPVTKLWGKRRDPIMRPVPDDGEREITCSGLAKTWKTMDGKTRIHVEYPFGIPMLLKIIDSELIAPNQWKYTCEHALKSAIASQITGGQATFGINTYSTDIEQFATDWGLPYGYNALEPQIYYAYNLAERGNGSGFASPGYKLPLSQSGFSVLPIGKDRDGVQHDVYVQAMVYLAGAGNPKSATNKPGDETPKEAMAYFCMPNAIDGECEVNPIAEPDYDGGTYGD